jgi:hypothetical protein
VCVCVVYNIHCFALHCAGLLIVFVCVLCCVQHSLLCFALCGITIVFVCVCVVYNIHCFALQSKAHSGIFSKTPPK